MSEQEEKNENVTKTTAKEDKRQALQEKLGMGIYTCYRNSNCYAYQRLYI